MYATDTNLLFTVAIYVNNELGTWKDVDFGFWMICVKWTDNEEVMSVCLAIQKYVKLLVLAKGLTPP